MPSQQADWRGEIIQLSWKPRAYHLRGFLTDEECEHIKHIVRACACVPARFASSAQPVIISHQQHHAPEPRSATLPSLLYRRALRQLGWGAWRRARHAAAAAASSAAHEPDTPAHAPHPPRSKTHAKHTSQSKDQLTASDVVNNLTGKSERSSVRLRGGGAPACPGPCRLSSVCLPRLFAGGGAAAAACCAEHQRCAPAPCHHHHQPAARAPCPG